MFVLSWNGQQIPNCDPPEGTYKAIKRLGLDHLTTERLWNLWASCDALIADRDEELFFNDPFGELLDCIESDSFQSNAVEAATKDPDPDCPDGVDWAAQLPAFVRANYPARLNLTVT